MHYLYIVSDGAKNTMLPSLKLAAKSLNVNYNTLRTKIKRAGGKDKIKSMEFDSKTLTIKVLN